MKKLIVLIFVLALSSCASPHQQNLGVVRPVTSFPTITPVDADYFILSDVSNSSLFSRATLANTKTALGVALTATGFNGNLATTDDTLQEVAQKLDDLDIGGVANDTAYDATTWDANTDAPTKNTVRDVIETFPSLAFSTGLTETDGTVTVTPNTYQPLDTDLTAAAGAGSATNSTFFGKDAGGTVGFHSVSAGSFALDTYPAYEDSPHSGSGIAENGTTVAMYSPTTGKWMTIATMADTLDPAPAGISDDFSSDTTANYTNIIQTLSISGGVAHGTVWENNTAAYHETTTGSNDHWVSATCTAGDTDSACVMLGSNGTDYYFSEFAGGVFKIWSSVGSYSVVYNGSYADGAHTVAIQIDTDGSSHPRFNAWIDGVQRITNDSDTADSITRGPYVGLRFDRGTTGVDVTVDNLAAGSGVYTP